jgi:hypothetical protein
MDDTSTHLAQQQATHGPQPEHLLPGTTPFPLPPQSPGSFPPPPQPTLGLTFEQFQLWYAQCAMAYGMQPQPPHPPWHTISSSPDSLPRGVKAPSVEHFDGRSTRLVRPWIDRTRGILRLSGFDIYSTKAVIYAASFLIGQAHSWFQGEQERYGHNPDRDI